jgi:hypothetical protein
MIERIVSSKLRIPEKHKKSRVCWPLLGWGGDDDDGWDEMHEAAVDVAQERCRPSVITWKSWNMPSLQQNNSAIAEQVESRDLIIDELNDRVAVFEKIRSC